MKYNNRVCRIKQVNADQAEQTIVANLATLSQDDLWLNTTIDELNRDMKAKVAPMEKELAQIKTRIMELDREIDNFVQALAKGRISVDRLETEMQHRESDKKALQSRQEALQQKICEESAYEFNAEAVKRNLTDFDKVFAALTPDEQKEALQCMLQKVTVFPDKFVLNVYELSDFKRGSTNCSNWLPCLPRLGKK
jgi:chromosome segregation ATPase